MTWPLAPNPSYYANSSWRNYGQKRNGVHYPGDTVEVFQPFPSTDTDVKTANFGRGQLGAVITTSSYEGDASPWNNTFSGTAVYDTHLGEEWAKFSNTSQLSWDITATNHYGRVNAILSAYPAVSLRLAKTISASLDVPIVFITTAGKVQATDTSLVHSITSATTVPLDAEFRVEYHFVHSLTVGQVELRIFLDPTSNVPTESISSPATWNTQSACQRVSFAGANGITLRTRRIVANYPTWPGPGDIVPATSSRDYEVTNYFGETLSTGSFEGSTCTPDPPSGGWPLGWYRIYFTGLGTDPVYGESCGVTNFCVIRDDPHFPPMPTGNTTGGGGGEQPDFIMKGVMGMGTSRHLIEDAANPNSGNDTLGNAVIGAPISAQYWSDPGAPYADPERAREQWCAFPNGTVDFVALPGSVSGYYLIVYPKTPAINGATTFVRLEAGSVSGSKITVRSPDASTIVETYDNLANATAAAAALSASAYVVGFSAGSTLGGTLAATEIGTAYKDGVGLVVSTLYPLGVTRYEGPCNEATFKITPLVSRNAGMGPEISLQMRLFQASVHAGNAAAIAMGPSSVEIYADRLEPFFAAGGGQWCDELAFHAYNGMTNSNLPLGRHNFELLLAMLATHGLQDKVLWQTESTQAITTQFGDFQVRRARFQLAYMILFEQYGFAAEKNCPWYDQSHGFWSFPAYLEFGDGSLQPQAVLSRVLAEEFWGKPYASALDFGEAGNSIVFGNIYTSGDTGESVAAVMFPALMHNASVTLTVTGTTDDLVSVGGFGEEGVLEQTDGRVTFSPLDVPFYVRLPAGATVEPYGINGVTIASLATNLALTASSKLIGGQERPEIADGLFMSRYTGNYGSPGEVFSPAATLQSPSGIHTYLPDSAELVWDEDVEVGTLAVWCPPAWQYGTALLNFDIETTLDGVTWDTQKTVDVSASAETFRFGSGGSNAACTIETYWGEQCTFLETLSPSVVCRGVRINVSETSYGGQPDLLGIQTCPDTQGGASGAQLLVLQEFQAYGAGIIPPVQPPVVNTDPVASGTTVVGQDVETTDGLWDNDPTSFAYQWQKSTNGTTGWTNISGATDATYTIGSALNHKFLRAAVTASNDVGESDPAFSNVLGPVTRPSPPHGGSSPGGSMLPGGTTVYLPRKRARKTGFKRRRM